MKSLVYAKLKIEQVVEKLPEKPKGESIYFAFDPEEEEIIQIEAVEEDPKPSNIFGYLYRVDFDKQSNHKILLLT